MYEVKISLKIIPAFYDIYSKNVGDWGDHMEINDVKTIDFVANYTSPQNTGESNVKAESGIEAEKGRSQTVQKSADATKEKRELTKEEIDKGNYLLNKFMENINSDIKFIYHEKSQRMMVQVVDTKEHKVLKEFPPSELLDIMANIREYVGVLLDKKA